MSGPARGYSWEPFEPGNPWRFRPGNEMRFQPGHELSLHHGAYSPRKVEPLAREMVDNLLSLDEVAYVRAPQYRPTLWRWATAQARADLVAAALADHGDCTGCKRCAAWERRWLLFSASADHAGRRLGLDPLSRARLGRDVTAVEVDVARLFAAYAAEDEAKERDQEADGA